MCVCVNSIGEVELWSKVSLEGWSNGLMGLGKGVEIEISVGIVAEESSLLKCFVGYDVWSDGDCAECFVTVGEIYWLWKFGCRIYFEWNCNHKIKSIVLLLSMKYEENIVIIIEYEYCIGSN